MVCFRQLFSRHWWLLAAFCRAAARPALWRARPGRMLATIHAVGGHVQCAPLRTGPQSVGSGSEACLQLASATAALAGVAAAAALRRARRSGLTSRVGQFCLAAHLLLRQRCCTLCAAGRQGPQRRCGSDHRQRWWPCLVLGTALSVAPASLRGRFHVVWPGLQSFIATIADKGRVVDRSLRNWRAAVASHVWVRCACSSGCLVGPRLGARRM